MVGKKTPRFVLGALAASLLLLVQVSLFLPAAHADSTYVVQAGDSLSGIAGRFSSSVQAIASANNIKDPNLIHIGQALRIPDGAPASPAIDRARPAPSPSGSILGNRRLLTYYGNPFDARMGILGALSKQELIDALWRRAAIYEALGDRPVQPAIHFIATVAQVDAGADGKYRARMPMDVVEEYADLAAQNGMLFFIDIQFGRSTVQEELAPWIPLLSRPDVHLALDPEFDMWGSQLPGVQLGYMTADEINYAQQVLTNLVTQNGLPNKVLIVHQFDASMLPDKGNIRDYPAVEMVIDMDGFGSQSLKLKHYQWYVQDELIEYAGIKLFFDQDVPLFTPEQIMNFDLVPDVIIYQ